MGILKRVTRDGQRIIFNARNESSALMQNENESYTFDAAGRLVGVFYDEKNYRRSLDNQILEKARGAAHTLRSRQRRMLTTDEIQALETRAYEFARALPARLAEPLPPEFADALARIGTYSFARLQAERAAFRKLYHPVSILPPDQYLALYLQATEGCSYNECAFCGLYRDRRFHAKTIAEFRKHLAGVRAFFGAGITLRRSIFLGDANALILPQPQLIEMFDAVNAEFEIMPRGLTSAARREWQAARSVWFDGIYSFIDAFTTKRKTAQAFAALAERGLRRVYIGLESGAASLLKFLGKPSQPEDVRALTTQLKKGGVAVGIIILIGAGGKEYDASHVRETIRLINALSLDQDDLIYFSELVDYPGSTYTALAQTAGIHALTPADMERQQQEMRAGFQFAAAPNAPKISHYDVREFLY